MCREAPHILVTGSHRSGTTWVGRTIAQMPGVRYVQEPFSVDFPGHEMTLRLRHWFAHFESSPQQDEIRKAFDDLFHPTAFRYAWLRFRRAPRGMERIGRFFSEVLSPPEHPRVLVKDLDEDINRLLESGEEDIEGIVDNAPAICRAPGTGRTSAK